MRRWIVSLSDLNLDRSSFRQWDSLMRDPDWRERAKFLDRLKGLLTRIPAIERDVIELYFFNNKRQEVIARLMGVSQQAVSHRMYSAFRRIIFLMEQPEVSPVQMRADLAALLPNPAAIDILCDFAVTSSQTATARNLGVHQQKINWHLTAALRALRDVPAIDAIFYTAYFEHLMRHRNILRMQPDEENQSAARPARTAESVRQRAALSADVGRGQRRRARTATGIPVARARPRRRTTADARRRHRLAAAKSRAAHASRAVESRRAQRGDSEAAHHLHGAA